MVHEIKRRLMIPFKCLCCQPKADKLKENKSNDEHNDAENEINGQVIMNISVNSGKAT